MLNQYHFLNILFNVVFVRYKSLKINILRYACKPCLIPSITTFNSYPLDYTSVKTCRMDACRLRADAFPTAQSLLVIGFCEQ